MNIFKLKKAEGLSLNVIIVAILALLVLVILALIFTGKIKGFGTQTRSCENIGGTCETGCEPNEATVRDTDCLKGACCIDTYQSATDDNI